MKLFFIFLFGLLISGGCVSSQFMTVGAKTFAPWPPDHLIEIYLPVESPVVVQRSIGNAKAIASLPTSAQMIGRIDTNGSADASWSSVFADAQTKARLLGGDAIVIKHWGSPMAGMVYGQAVYAKSISMDVFRFSEDMH